MLLTSFVMMFTVYLRFTPAFTEKEDIARFHGYNERIAVSNYVQVVEFYHRVIRNADTFVGDTEDTVDTVQYSGEGSGEDVRDVMFGSGHGENTGGDNLDEYQLLDGL